MQELIAALTAFLKEATVYLGKQNGKASATLVPTDATPSEPKVAKPRKVKEPEAAAPAPVLATPDATPDMTEKESYDELCKLAIGFIAADKPGTEERRTKAMSHVEATYRVSALSAVPHGPQRLQLIEWFKGNLPKISAPAVAPAGFGV